jgi:hypothetical protein
MNKDTQAIFARLIVKSEVQKNIEAEQKRIAEVYAKGVQAMVLASNQESQ